MAASVALTLAVAPTQAEEINFGIISTEASSNLKKIWDPFLADMEKGTGLKINAFFASDYAGVIEGMRFKKVQIAWFGNKSAMEAVDRAEGEVFAQTVAANGDAGYYSHIIVHKDSPYQNLDDVLKCDKSLDFGIGDPNSTSGFLVPTTFIFSAKSIDPKVCFKTVRNANHEANALAVANKLVHVAANNSENLERVGKTAPAARDNIRIIWTSPLIPSVAQGSGCRLEEKALRFPVQLRQERQCRSRRQRQEDPGRAAVGAVQEIGQQPVAADPADGAQQGDYETERRRKGRRGGQGDEARRAREAVHGAEQADRFAEAVGVVRATTMAMDGTGGSQRPCRGLFERPA